MYYIDIHYKAVCINNQSALQSMVHLNQSWSQSILYNIVLGLVVYICIDDVIDVIGGIHLCLSGNIANS